MQSHNDIYLKYQKTFEHLNQYVTPETKGVIDQALKIIEELGAIVVRLNLNQGCPPRNFEQTKTHAKNLFAKLKKLEESFEKADYVKIEDEDEDFVIVD
jgi:hypothetical protein